MALRQRKLVKGTPRGFRSQAGLNSRLAEGTRISGARAVSRKCP